MAAAAAIGLGAMVSPSSAFSAAPGLRPLGVGTPLSSAGRGASFRQGARARVSMMSEDAAESTKKVDEAKAALEEMMGGSTSSAPAASLTELKSEVSVPAPKKKKPSKPAASGVPKPAPFEDPNKTPPPGSFAKCVEQAYLSVQAAIDDGKKLIEVEFPPLPQSALDNSALGADVITDAQISHARQFARYFGDKKVAIVFPDIVERNRFMGDTSFGGKSSKMKEDKLYDTVSDNVRYSALGGGFKGSFLEKLWVQQEYVEDIEEDDDVFVIITASAQELPDVRKFCEGAGDRPVILFNLKLQTLRGDFGLPAFPGKDLQYEWLGSAFPAYHVLPRAYTRTIPRPPFLVNYSGCLFRTYPGKWQVLLEVPDTDKGGGRYEQVQLRDKRPALSELRELLAEELQLDGLDDNEEGDKKLLGVDLATLRKGVIVKTWWEQDIEKTKSDDWRN
uniref:DUF1995 domain-containing protein n=1 Tax=Hemiselmis andersenii TaxID=464988 RepID=A0A6T8PIZ3_HEMAN